MPRTAVTNADFYLLESSLEPAGRQLLLRIREFMENRSSRSSTTTGPRRSSRTT
jgi:hypothetical protein